MGRSFEQRFGQRGCDSQSHTQSAPGRDAAQALHKLIEQAVGSSWQGFTAMGVGRRLLNRSLMA